jgi:hypothetical protein
VRTGPFDEMGDLQTPHCRLTRQTVGAGTSARTTTVCREAIP